jgi:hypothetical protein
MGSLFQAANLPSTMILRYARDRKQEERGRDEARREGYTETERQGDRETEDRERKMRARERARARVGGGRKREIPREIGSHK